jgi:hypothetical protein
MADGMTEKQDARVALLDKAAAYVGEDRLNHMTLSESAS